MAKEAQKKVKLKDSGQPSESEGRAPKQSKLKSFAKGVGGMVLGPAIGAGRLFLGVGGLVGAGIRYSRGNEKGVKAFFKSWGNELTDSMGWHTKPQKLSQYGILSPLLTPIRGVASFWDGSEDKNKTGRGSSGSGSKKSGSNIKVLAGIGIFLLILGAILTPFGGAGIPLLAAGAACCGVAAARGYWKDVTKTKRGETSNSSSHESSSTDHDWPDEPVKKKQQQQEAPTTNSTPDLILGGKQPIPPLAAPGGGKKKEIKPRSDSPTGPSAGGGARLLVHSGKESTL